MAADRTAFVGLDDFVLAPPLPALLAAGMGLGLVALGRALAHAVYRRDPDPVEHALGFVAVVASFGAVLHGAAMAGLLGAGWLRGSGWLLAGIGWISGVRALRSFASSRTAPTELAPPLEFDRGDRWCLRLSFVLAVGWTILALLPPTDADSLDYHLGVPLEWLRHGGVVARPDWLTMRVVGLGEALNAFGLAAGTDAFGSVLQASGLLVAIAAVSARAKDALSRTTAILVVLTLPVLLALVPAQKPQFLPAAAIVLGLVAVVEREDRRTLAFAAVAIAFGIACKYSFLLTGGVAFLALFVVAARRGRWTMALALGALALLAFPAPVYLRNAMLYGDPLSPLLERFRADPDPIVLSFAAYLRAYGGAPTLPRLLIFPFEAAFTFVPGRISTVLGVAAFAVFASKRRADGPGRILLATAAIAAFLTLALGQLAPRFFLEPALFTAAYVVGNPAPPRLVVFRALLVVQGLFLAVPIVLGALGSFPAMFTSEGRHDLLDRSAFGYAEARWLDRILPPDAVLLTRSRTHALHPRPFVTAVSLSAPSLSEDAVRTQLSAWTREAGVNVVVVDPRADRALLAFLRPCLKEPEATKRFVHAARNPFNRGATHERRVIGVDLDAPGCPLR